MFSETYKVLLQCVLGYAQSPKLHQESVTIDLIKKFI